MVYIDLDGTILMWNAAAERVYGFGESEAPGKLMGLILPLYEVHSMEEILRNARGIDSEAWESAERLGKEGRHLPLRIRRAAVRTQTGELLGVVEKAIPSSSLEIDRRAETHLRQLVEQMPVAFWTTDLRLQITCELGRGVGACECFGANCRSKRLTSTCAARSQEKRPSSNLWRHCRESCRVLSSGGGSVFSI